MFSRLQLPRVCRIAFRCALLLSVALLFQGASPKGRGGDRIWSALVLASNVDDPGPPPPELARFTGNIKRVFGYNQVRLVGSATKTVDEDCERWLVPSQNFWMSVKAKQGADGNYLLNLELFHDKRRLVQSDVKIGPDGPIVIRGPMHATGQLLIVLQVIE